MIFAKNNNKLAATTSKRYEIGCKLLLITNVKRLKSTKRTQDDFCNNTF